MLWRGVGEAWLKLLRTRIKFAVHRITGKAYTLANGIKFVAIKC